MEMQKKTMSLTLEPDNNPDLFMDDPAPVMKQMAGAVSQGEYAAGMIDDSMLSKEERQQVEDFYQQIDIGNENQVSFYGSEAQNSIRSFSESFLKHVKTFDLGDMGDTLRELTVALDSTTEPKRKGFLGLFQKGKQVVNSVRANYATAESNVNRVQRDLEHHQVLLHQDIAMYDQMYELNMDYYKKLTMYIIAGKKALALGKGRHLPELQRKAQMTGKQEDLQACRDYESQCNRFEQKLSDLEITRAISMQQAPQIRMLQDNDRKMLDKIQASLVNTIPLWRNQLIISVGIEHSRRAAEAQRTLSDKTNELLMQNAQNMRMAAAEIAREAERPIVDMDTMRKCNQELITSIREVMKIHEEGSRERTKTHDELVKLETELRNAMLEASTGRL